MHCTQSASFFLVLPALLLLPLVGSNGKAKEYHSRNNNHIAFYETSKKRRLQRQRRPLIKCIHLYYVVIAVVAVSAVAATTAAVVVVAATHVCLCAVPSYARVCMLCMFRSALAMATNPTGVYDSPFHYRFFSIFFSPLPTEYCWLSGFMLLWTILALLCYVSSLSGSCIALS